MRWSKQLREVYAGAELHFQPTGRQQGQVLVKTRMRMMTMTMPTPTCYPSPTKC